MPRFRVATPQVTGNRWPSVTPRFSAETISSWLSLGAFEVALHELVRVLGDLVHQLLAELGRELGDLLGNLGLVLGAAAVGLVEEGLHVDQVDDPPDLVLGADRDLGRDDVRAERRLEPLQRGEEVGALAVEHVDEDESRKAGGGGPVPEPVGPDLDARRRR